MTVVTRFAPSPTGFLHIGGARTALFCWLYARHTGGKFLLRIEDTDKERSTKEAVDAIFEGLTWLGLQGDEPAVMQGDRAERHREVGLELVRRGAAYLCPVTAEELEARRTRAVEVKIALESGEANSNTRAAMEREREGLLRPFRSPWRDPALALPPGKPTVVRLRMPDHGHVEMEDRVQGLVRVAAKDLDDLVLLRSDGTPTYMLAVVVDDHDMGVTHVIRGDDHLTNTFRQLPIYTGMGWRPPEHAHVPMIHGPDGKKLSKRHGALGVHAYRDLGYLPEGLKNYLLRLGWSHGNDEIIGEAQAIEWFDLEGLGKAPARLDLAKLKAVNAHYMAQVDDDRLADLFFALPLAAEEADKLSDAARVRIRAAMAVLKVRAATVVALKDAAAFLMEIRPIRLTGKSAALIDAAAKDRLAAIADRLQGIPDWSGASIKEELDRYCADTGVGLGKIGPLLRAVLTGGAHSPDISLVLALLGRTECLARIRDQTGGTVHDA
ncbi:MAG: glutamate--tRNA ligase [Alphaproteobacteria bacterium]|nr:glutamate--tRNA ligase [Alphaproteobacteria bacterium]